VIGGGLPFGENGDGTDGCDQVADSDKLRRVYVAEDPQSSSISGPVLLIVLLAFGTIYLFGYLRAVMHRANSDYKKTKASVKPLRKAFWSSWLAALRTGAIVLIGLLLMVAWFVRDTRNANGSEPTPAPSPSASVSKTAR
jgi:ABC-type Fe3+ transport system permease subunit